MYLRHATTGTVNLGPFIDVSDGVTPISGVAITDAQVQLLKGNNGPVQKNESSDLVYTSGGWYQCTLDATDTNTIGRLIVQSQNASVHLPVWHEFYILPTGVFDTYYGENAQGSELPKVDVRKWVNTTLSAIPDIYPQVDVQQIDGSSSPANNLALSAANNPINVNVEEWLDVAVSLSGNLPNVNIETISSSNEAARNLELDYDGTGYAKTNSTIGTVTNVTNAVSGNVVRWDGHLVTANNTVPNVNVSTWAAVSVSTSGDLPNVNIEAISSDNEVVRNLESDYNGTGYNKSNSTIGIVSSLATDAIGSGDISTSAMQYLADTILSRSVKEVEGAADKYSLTRVILAATSWEMVANTGLIIRDTAGNEWTVVPISGDAGANLVVSLG